MALADRFYYSPLNSEIQRKWFGNQHKQTDVSMAMEYLEGQRLMGGFQGNSFSFE